MDTRRIDPYHGLRSRENVAQRSPAHCTVLDTLTDMDAKRTNRHEGFMNLSKSLAKLGNLPYHGLPSNEGQELRRLAVARHSNRIEKRKRSA